MIGDLTANLHRRDFVGSLERHPLVRGALVRIGQPAISRLLDALSDPNTIIRIEASKALGEIGAASVEGLLDALSHGGPSARAGAVLALSRIGGVRARKAIEGALRTETNEEVISELGYAIEYMDHVQLLKHSNR